MKKTILTSLVALVSLTVTAQESGYYRLQNRDTKRYLTIVDTHVSTAGIDRTTELNMYALRTVTGFENVASDPGSIIYIEKTENGYSLKGQGFDTYAQTGLYLNFTASNDGSYRIWGTATKSGMTFTKYLRDADDEWFDNIGYVSTDANENKNSPFWNLIPVTTDDNQYLGLKGDVKANGNKYYTTFYASYPIKLGEGMKAYTVTETNEGAAKLVNIGSEVPASTGVVIECAGANAADNKITPIASTSATAEGNLLEGVYFCNVVLDPNDKELKNDINWNTTDYNKETMRLLGIVAGEDLLAFTTSAGTKYLPANKAYLPVASETAASLLALEKEAYTGINSISNDDTTTTAKGIYTLMGTKVEAKTLKPGIYIQNGKKVVIK